MPAQYLATVPISFVCPLCRQGHREVFKLIHEKKLYSALLDNLIPLMEVDIKVHGLSGFTVSLVHLLGCMHVAPCRVDTTLLFALLINARRACARGLQYFVCLSVCLFVCYQSPGFFSRLYDKLDLPACSSLVFLGFQLTDFDKTVLFGR